MSRLSVSSLPYLQEAADAHPMQLSVDDGAESSGTQAALSDVSTTYVLAIVLLINLHLMLASSHDSIVTAPMCYRLGDWDIDCIVPDLGYGTSMVNLCFILLLTA